MSSGINKDARRRWAAQKGQKRAMEGRVCPACLRGNALSRAGLEDSSIGEPTVRCRYCPYVRVRRSLDEYDRLRVRALDVAVVEEAGEWWLRHSLGRVGPFTSPVEARIYALDRLWRLR